MAQQVARGEIWTYEFSAPDKKRPVLVVMRDRLISHCSTILVAPITTTIRGLPTEVLVGVAEGLKSPSAVKLESLQSVDKSRLRQFVGTLPSARMTEVCRALAVATGCE